MFYRGLKMVLREQPRIGALLVESANGESERHFQTDRCCPQNGETPKYKKDMGHQAVGLPGEAGSRGGGGQPYPAIPTGRTCPGALLNRQPET